MSVTFFMNCHFLIAAGFTHFVSIFNEVNGTVERLQMAAMKHYLVDIIKLHNQLTR